WSPESCSSRPAAPLDLRRHALRLHPLREVVQRTREVPDRHRPLRRGGLSWSSSVAARRRRDASLASRGGGGGFVRALARHSHLAGGRIPFDRASRPIPACGYCARRSDPQRVGGVGSLPAPTPGWHPGRSLVGSCPRQLGGVSDIPPAPGQLSITASRPSNLSDIAWRRLTYQ